MSLTSGVLPVDKPVGPTSHDVVAMARRALGTRRIGHTGTLDPFASGLLLLCLGSATRLSEYLTGLSKRYVATVRLGAATDTDDHTGEVVSRSEAWRDLSLTSIERAVGSQTGTLQQLPPIYSAKKVGGQRMYEAARRGEEIVRTPVEVTVYSIGIVRAELPELELEVHCSSGTYIRAIARDLGDTLGTGGHLAALRRTAIGTHTISDAIPVERLDHAEAVAGALLSPAGAVAHLPSLEVGHDEAGRIAHGGGLTVPAGYGDELAEGATVRLLDAAGELLAIAQRDGAQLRPRKVFTS